MLTSLIRSLPQLGRKWKPLNFSNPNFVRIPVTQKLEEQTMPDYVASRYYPAKIGDILQDKYQVVGKLGFGANSTVWLARDMRYRRCVTLKIYVKSASIGQCLDDKLNMYKRIEAGSKNHPGCGAVPCTSSSLGKCFDLSASQPGAEVTRNVLAFILKRLFLALDYLHTECQVIHTDIKAGNIMFGIADDSVFDGLVDGLVDDEIRIPCPRKELDVRTIYVSQELGLPKEWGAPALCDFGSAMPGGVEHLEDIQPNMHRAPEVILEAPWTYSVDIWNMGCMIWNIFEGETLFTGYDSEYQTYRSRAHLADNIRLLGPPPPDLIARGKLSHKFFSDEGDFCAGIPLKEPVPLEQRETTLEGQEKADFLLLVRKMLRWNPPA